MQQKVVFFYDEGRIHAYHHNNFYKVLLLLFMTWRSGRDVRVTYLPSPWLALVMAYLVNCWGCVHAAE